MSKLETLAREGNPAKIGIILAAIIILAGLFPNIQYKDLQIFLPIDSWLLILGGISMFFYFMSIKINQKDEVDDKGRVWTVTPIFKSDLSEECFNAAILSLFLFGSRAFYLLIKLLFQYG